MTKTKEERIETMEAELAALKSDLANEPKPWPQDEDDIFCLGSDGDIDDTYYDSDSDEDVFNQGNVFRTESDALKERNKRYLLVEMAQDNSFVPDWDDCDQVKHALYYDYNKLAWYNEPMFYHRHSQLEYYATNEDCKAAIKKYGKRMTECLL